MELRAVVLALIAGLNGLVENLEGVVSADGDAEQKPARRSQSKKKDEEPEEEEEKPARRPSRSEKKDEEPEEEEEEESGDEPSEDDVIDAVRAAQKVLEKDDVVSIIRKYGKCDRASQVPADRRQKVIDELEKAIDDAA